MSVIGIDFGNESCYVAVARAGGIETVDNDYSLRATSSTVAFGEKHRILGVPAKNQLVTNIKNTIWGFKRLLGRRWGEPQVMEQLKEFPFEVVPSAEGNGNLAVKVKYLGEPATFTMEQITAMLLTKLKETTETAISAKISDCVVSVPSFYTDCERRALLAAAKMAGLNVLRLMNDTAATSLTYGIYKQDLPESNEHPRNVVFVDCGHSALQVWVCAFNKGRLRILASTADPNLGGRDFDKVLASHFCAEFESRLKLRVQSNHRAYVRLLTEVEKLKKQMSANATKLPLNIECLMNDKDVSSSICRADFEHMCAPMLTRVDETLKVCLRDSKLQMKDIHSVEIVGGSTRIPAIKHLIEKVFGKVPSTTLNQDEAVARGCALQCAILSPAFKVKDFKIHDVQPYPIKVVWDDTLGEDGFIEVYPKYHPFPFSRVLTFFKKEAFQLKAQYMEDVPYPSKDIGLFRIQDINTGNGDPLKVRVKARINIDGIFSIISAFAYEECENGEEPMDTEPPSQETNLEESNQVNDDPQEREDGDEGANQESNKNANGTPNNQNEEGTAGANVGAKPQESNENGNEATMSQDEGETAPVDSKQKTYYKEIPLPVVTEAFGMTDKVILDMTETEVKMIAADRREKERIDARNALEEYVYALRDKLEGEFSQVVEESQKAKLTSELNYLETWLYEEGSEEKCQAYSDRLESLKKEANAIIESLCVEPPNNTDTNEPTSTETETLD